MSITFLKLANFTVNSYRERVKMVTTEASSKIAAFIYQIERALYRIFASEHNHVMVGIETADDVVEEIRFENGNIQITFEQDKHSVDETGQPYQDSSKNLWHTLHIWLNSMTVVKSQYDEIIYCLVTNKSVGSNTLASLISDAKNDHEIKEAIQKLKSHGANISGKVKNTVDVVLNYSDEDLYFLIKRTELLGEHGTNSGLSPKEATITLMHLPTEISHHSELIYSTIFGSVVSHCQKHWKERKQVVIKKSMVSKLLFDMKRKCMNERLSERSFRETSYIEYMKLNSFNNFLFIGQLKLLGFDDEACEHALKNYWAFYSEKIRLQEMGDIPLNAWENRDNALYDRWKEVTFNTLSKEKNDSYYCKIYQDTVDINYLAPLSGYTTTHNYFTSGNYHMLADEPENENFIYWHDVFKKYSS